MNSFFLATLSNVVHRGQTAGNGLSPRLWHRVRASLMSEDGALHAKLMGDDFSNIGALQPSASGTTAYKAHGGYGVYLDTTTTACSLTQTPAGNGGARLSVGATDNHQAWIQAGGGVGSQCRFASASADQKLLIFEARITPHNVGDELNAVFVGLGKPGLANDGTKVNDTGAMKDTSYIGFDSIHGTDVGEKLNFVYRASGESQETVESDVGTLVADTGINLGFIYDPQEVAAKRIKIFVDNTEIDTKITGTDMSAAEFPLGEWLSFLFGSHVGEATAASNTCDWYALYQEL